MKLKEKIILETYLTFNPVLRLFDERFNNSLVIIRRQLANVEVKCVRKLVEAYALTGTDTDIKPISPPHHG